VNGVAYVGMGEMFTKLWLENLKKRPLGRPRRGWEENMRMDRREIGWEGVNWIHLAQDERDHWRALVNTVTKLWVP